MSIPFEYIYDGKVHANTDREYMNSLGMTTEAIDSVLTQKTFEEKQGVKLRAEAYKRESDPLYIEWQFELEGGNASSDTYKQAWLDKVTEIKLRHPLPAKS